MFDETIAWNKTMFHYDFRRFEWTKELETNIHVHIANSFVSL